MPVPSQPSWGERFEGGARRVAGFVTGLDVVGRADLGEQRVQGASRCVLLVAEPKVHECRSHVGGTEGGSEFGRQRHHTVVSIPGVFQVSRYSGLCRGCGSRCRVISGLNPMLVET